MLYLAAGAALLAVLMLASRWFVGVSVSDLVQAARTFVAVFLALAGTGLIFMGRFGPAIALIGAAFMAGRSLLKGRQGADPMAGARGASGGQSTVTTELLVMRLDRATGDLDGEVRRGELAGRNLSALSSTDLLGLRRRAIAEDTASVSLIEAYLDRRYPDWRSDEEHEGAGSERASTGEEVMDEARALAILGLAKGASAEEIRSAHRRLMAHLHPDHGGSNYLASQINRARDVLLASGA